LKSRAIVSEFADAVKHKINNLLANGVVSTGKVVGCIFLTRDQLFWVEELTVSASSDLIDYGWLQVDHDATRDVLASASLRKEGVEGIIATTDGFITWHLPVRLDSMLKAEKLPARIANLHTSLSDVDAKSLTHLESKKKQEAVRLSLSATTLPGDGAKSLSQDA